jgi:FAD:protein FMN transferase
VTAQAHGRRRTARHVEQVMGLPVTLALRGRHVDDEPARQAWAAVLAELRHADRVFSTYRSDSAVSRVNAGELTLAECPAEVSEVLGLAEVAQAQSDGYFTVWLPRDGGTVLDPSGVVKGWALQRASAVLDGLDGTDSCLSGGGDMVCRVRESAGAPWRIGVEDPHDPQRVLSVVELRNGAIATSAATHRGHHVLDPFTGRPPQGVASVTVVGASLLWADVWATAAFAHGSQAASWLATRTDHRGLVVHPDGSTTST